MAILGRIEGGASSSSISSQPIGINGINSPLFPRRVTLRGEESQEDILSIFHEVFGNRKIFSEMQKDLIKSYLSDGENALISKYFYINPLPNFTSFLDVTFLQTYLSRNFQRPSHLSSALEIAQSIYEHTQSATDRSNGLIFPLNSELIAFLGEQVVNKIVVELGSASGKTAILLALAGAAKVYANDINASDARTFERLKVSLPPDVQAKLEFIGGNCLDLLKKKPAIANQADWILCGNLLHFLTTPEQNIFFPLIKNLLKIGGRGVFIVNSSTVFPDQSAVFEENPDATVFDLTQCFLTNYAISRLPCNRCYSELSVSHEEPTFSFEAYYLYERHDKTSYKWKVNNDEFNKLPRELRSKIRKSIEPYKGEILTIPTGSVRVLRNTQRIYTINTLFNLFKTWGFKVEATFAIDKNGHRILDQTSRPQQIGIIIKYL